MASWNPAEARRYHERTKHSFESVRRSGHYLDWKNRPNPFKQYLDVEPLPLPGDPPQPDVAALHAIAADATTAARSVALPDLARLLRWGAGVARTRKVPGGETYHFRTYPSAGALYPIEVYLASPELPGLAAGLYHFHPRELAVRLLRAGDFRDTLAAAADAPELSEAAAVLLLTGILWRSAWKYQARAYRHLYWDAGAMFANLIALAASAGLRPRLLTAFVDAEVNYLLGIDGDREAALALLSIGQLEPTPSREEIEQLGHEAAPLSPQELSHREASALHSASSFTSIEEVRQYRAGGDSGSADVGVAVSTPSAERLEAVELGTVGAALSREPLETVIRRRGSARDFMLDPIPASELAALLARAAAPIPSDVPPLTEIYVIAHALESIEPGAYRFMPPDHFELLRRGDFRARAGYLCLEQPLGAKAAATLFLLADLEEVLTTFGDRGYRAAQLEAGIRAGRLYLAAYAQGLGATGLTFYDDDVTEFFAPGTARSPMLCVAVGVDARRPKLRRLRA